MTQGSIVSLTPPGAPLHWWNVENVDGSDNSTMTDNDAVSSWHDAGSRAENADQATGSLQPVYRNTGVKEYLSFAMDVLATTTYTALPTPYTIALRAGFTTGTSGATYWIAGDGSTNRHIVGRNPGPDWGQFSGTAQVNQQAEMLDHFESVIAYFNGASSYLIVNGTELGPANPGNQDNVQVQIGGIGGLPFLTGRIKEVLLYSGDLRSEIQAYFDTKYGAGAAAY